MVSGNRAPHRETGSPRRARSATRGGISSGEGTSGCGRACGRSRASVGDGPTKRVVLRCDAPGGLVLERGPSTERSPVDACFRATTGASSRQRGVRVNRVGVNPRKLAVACAGVGRRKPIDP
jgi:hypothetical protein